MDPAQQPEVLPESGVFRAVHGTVHRAVDPAFADHALSGSRAAGRYSPPGAPTLYLSASPDGVRAAMIAHRTSRASALTILALEVTATRIADLRDHAELARLEIDPADAAADWQQDAAAGRTPPSWRVRERLEGLGAHGLIDPSRRRPGLWHLALFTWNRPGAPTVRILQEQSE